MDLGRAADGADGGGQADRSLEPAVAATFQVARGL
jgi:hypothetical protein